jgi:hypothetical protein
MKSLFIKSNKKIIFCFFEEVKMKLYYHIKKAFLAQDVQRKKHLNPNRALTIFTRQSQTAKADKK